MLDAALSVYRIENVGMENIRNMMLSTTQSGVACTIEACEPTKAMLDAALSVYRIENVGMENIRNMIRAALMAREGIFPAATETKQ